MVGLGGIGKNDERKLMGIGFLFGGGSDEYVHIGTIVMAAQL